MTDRPRKPTDAQIISFAMALLRAGILPSAIPARLMEEYGLTPEKAGELAGKAISRHRRGRLDTKPLDEPG